MIIGLSGKMQSGKDVVSEIIKWYSVFYEYKQLYSEEEIDKLVKDKIDNYLIDKRKVCDQSRFRTVKFADKLKDIVCILINCTREDLESNEFKETPLGAEWDYWKETSSWGGRTVIFGTKPNYDAAHLSGRLQLTPRKLLQLIGTECGRNIIHPNIWVNSTLGEYTNDLVHYYNFNPDCDEHVVYDNPNFSIASVLRCDTKSYTKEEAIDKFYKEFTKNWIISDVRFDNELEAITDKGGLIIRVERFCYDSAEDFCVCHPIKKIQQQGIEIVENYSGEEFFEKMDKLAYDNGFVPLKNQHESEKNLDDYPFKYKIYNFNIDKTIEQVKQLLIENKII